MRYSKQDKPYDQMENDFTTTGTRNHLTVIPCINGETSTYYLRAKDVYGNTMDTSATITFTSDTTKIYADWKSLLYDDSQWKSGPSPFGSGSNTDIATNIANVNTAYFRKKFNLANPTSAAEYRFLFRGYDGAVVYINSKEFGRMNMPESEVDYSTFALSLSYNDITNKITGTNGLQNLVSGENIIALEVHKSNSDSSNINFDSRLTDNHSKLYFNFGSDWLYYDAGDRPADQINEKPTGVENLDLIPSEFSLEQNYPNPYNPSTTIKFSIPPVETLHATSQRQHASLIVYDVLGRKVAIFINEQKAPGNYKVSFDGSKLSSGIYFYVLKAGNNSITKKMMLLK